MRIRQLLLAAILGASLFAGGCGGKEPEATVQGTPTVAEVDGIAITRNDFMRALEDGIGLSENFVAGRLVLDNLIGKQLVEKKLEELKIEVNDAELKKALDSAKKGIASSYSISFEDFLKKTGVTEAEIMKQLKYQLALRKLVVTQSEIEEFYTAHAKEFNQPEAIKYHAMTFQTKAAAEAAYKEVAAGKKDMNAVAKEKGVMPPGSQTLSEGTAYMGQLPDKAFEKALFALKPGELSKPLSFNIPEPTATGQPSSRQMQLWLVIKVKSREPAKTFTLEERKDEVRETLFRQKNTTGDVARYINNLKTKARINILDNRYKSLKEDYDSFAKEESTIPGRPQLPPGGPQPMPAPLRAAPPAPR